jgi:hypothetical protein
MVDAPIPNLGGPAECLEPTFTGRPSGTEPFGLGSDYTFKPPDQGGHPIALTGVGP